MSELYRPVLRFRGFRSCSVFFLAVFALACEPRSSFDSPEGGRSVLTLLDTDGRRLDVGDEVEGALSASDYLGPRDSYLEAWTVDGRPGDKFSIDLISDEFDSYLYVVGPGFVETLRDDDGGGACHARVDFTVLESGVFHVVVSSLSAHETGTYRLRVSETPAARLGGSCGGVSGSSLLSLETAGRILRSGETAFGTMTGAEFTVDDDRPVQAWTLEGSAGESVTIRLESEDYDAYLYMFGPGMSGPLTDDDGGSGLDSELTVTFPETGTFVVGAGALTSGAVGSYTLTVTRPVDLSTLMTAGRSLQMGSTVSGVLTDADAVFDGQPVQAWSLDARSGDYATIELRSADFDSYLYVVGPGISTPLSDDDGGDGLDSRLSVSFPQDGTYRVIASSLRGDTGSFTLRVR